MREQWRFISLPLAFLSAALAIGSAFALLPVGFAAGQTPPVDALPSLPAQPEASRALGGRVRTSAGAVIDLYKDSYALVVGNANYTAGMDPLPGAVRDAREVAQSLERLGFKTRVETDLTKERFERVFAEFVLESGNDPENQLLFYFAGHGHTETTATNEEMGYLVMVDSPDPATDRVGFSVKNVDMVYLVTQAKMIRAKHVLFVFDSCFSGSILNLRESATPHAISDSVRYPVRQFITAGRANEPVPDHSVFKQCFLDLLEGRDKEPIEDGYVTGEELGLYLKTKVPQYRDTQHPQFGKIRDPNLDKGDFVFQLASVAPSSVAFSNQAALRPAPSELEEKLGQEESRRARVEKARKAYERLGSVASGGDVASVEEAKRLADLWEAYVREYGEPTGYQLAEAQERRNRFRAWRPPTPRPRPTPVPPTPTPKPAGPRPGQIESVDLGGGVALEMVWVPGGTFEMGSEMSAVEVARRYGGKAENFEDEHPTHRVELDGFWMGRTETTLDQFRRFSEAESYRTDAENAGKAYAFDWDSGEWKEKEGISWRAPGFSQTGSHPVVCVSWNDARAFCAWLGRRGEMEFALPTEAQWEYACRAGSTTAFCWGDDASAGAGWMNGCDTSCDNELKKHDRHFDFPFPWDDGYVYTSPVGSFRKNAFGLYDMHGNGWEWCADWYGNYSSSSQRNPVGPSSGQFRVLRGGSWGYAPRYCRSAYRIRVNPSIRSGNVGFRVVGVGRTQK